MSDAASQLTGAAAPAAPNGGSPATAPAPDGGAAPAAAPAGAPAAPAPGAPAAPAAPAAAWTDALDADGKAFVEARGFKSPADALKALRDNAPPASADKYELPVPEGEDPAFAQSVAPLMHKAGLSAAQAKVLAEGWNELQAAERAKAAEAAQAAEREAGALAEREEAELKREWGQAFDANAEHGRRAVAQFVPGDTAAKQRAMQALEGVIGYAGMMRMFSGIGQLIKEDTAHGLGQRPGASAVDARGMYDKSNMNP
jgi:hypothetical protein